MNLGSYSTFSKLENCHEIHLHNCCFFYFESCDVYFELIFMFSIYFCIILYHILSYVIYHYCINYFHLNSSVSFSALDFLSKIKNSCRFEDFSYNFKAGLLYLETKSHTRKCCPLETQRSAQHAKKNHPQGHNGKLLLIAFLFPHEAEWAPLSNHGGKFYGTANNRIKDLPKPAGKTSTLTTVLRELDNWYNDEEQRFQVGKLPDTYIKNWRKNCSQKIIKNENLFILSQAQQLHI